jgi:hypothetical protein
MRTGGSFRVTNFFVLPECETRYSHFLTAFHDEPEYWVQFMLFFFILAIWFAAIPILEPNTYIVDIDYSPLVGGFAVVLNDGRAAFLTAASLKFDPNVSINVYIISCVYCMAVWLFLHVHLYNFHLFKL